MIFFKTNKTFGAAIFIFLVLINGIALAQNKKADFPKLSDCRSLKLQNESVQHIESDNAHNIYLLTSKKIYSYNHNLELNWNLEMEDITGSNGEAVSTRIFISDDSVLKLSESVLVDNIEKKIYLELIGKTTGLTKWQKDITKDITSDLSGCLRGKSGIENIKIVEDGDFFVLATKANCNFYYSKQNGIFFRIEKNNFGQLAAANSNFSVYVNEYTNRITALGKQNQKTNDIYLKILPKSFFLDEETFYATDDIGVIYKIDINGKVLWKTKFGGAITNLSRNGTEILISSKDNFLYYLKTKNGKTIWKKRFSGKTLAVVNPSDKLIYAVVVGEPELFLLNLEKGSIIDKAALEAGSYFKDRFGLLGGKVVFETNEGLQSFSTNSGCIN